VHSAANVCGDGQSVDTKTVTQATGASCSQVYCGKCAATTTTTGTVVATGTGDDTTQASGNGDQTTTTLPPCPCADGLLAVTASSQFANLCPTGSHVDTTNAIRAAGTSCAMAYCVKCSTGTDNTQAPTLPPTVTPPTCDSNSAANTIINACVTCTCTAGVRSCTPNGNCKVTSSNTTILVMITPGTDSTAASTALLEAITHLASIKGVTVTITLTPVGVMSDSFSVTISTTQPTADGSGNAIAPAIAANDFTTTVAGLPQVQGVSVQSGNPAVAVTAATASSASWRVLAALPLVAAVVLTAW